MARRLVVVISAATLAAGTLLAVATSSQASAPRRMMFAQSAAPARELAHPAGSLRASTRVHFELVLSLRHTSAAKALATGVSTPTSSSYRHFITAKQWERTFSPTASSVARARRWLRASKFHVGAVSKDRLTVSATGTVQQIRAAFHTSLGAYRVQGHVLRLATRDLSVPESLAGAVAGVMGVSQRPMAVPRQATTAAQTTKTAAAGDPAPPAAFITSPDCDRYYGQHQVTEHPTFKHGYPASVPNTLCGYTPAQLRSAYGIPASDNGAGKTIAIILWYASATEPADATRYYAAHDPQHPFTDAHLRQVIDRPFTDVAACGGAQDEEAIDLEASHALAPKAHLVYVGAANCDDGPFTALQQVVDNHLANIVSNSYDDPAGDLLDPISTLEAYQDELLLAAATGITVLFASGDDGDDFDLAGVSAAEFPASSPLVTAVGGTTLGISAAGRRSAEYGWSTGASYLCTANVENLAPGCDRTTLGSWPPLSADGASGGYTSYSFTEPGYQKGVVPAALAQRNSNYVLSSGENMRVVPDISMDADPSTGMRLGFTETFADGSVHYGETRFGGTSLATPILAGVVADAAQAAHSALGFLNPTLYRLDKTDPSVINDIRLHRKLGQYRVDYASQIFGGTGNLDTFRAITYEGDEQFCDATGNCATRPNTLTTAKGYDSLTGLGSINPGFIPALSAPRRYASH